MTYRLPLSIACAALVLLCATRTSAQEHGHHNATERLGTVHFATSCAPAVAPAFDRGIALLHSFEFGASINAFSGVLQQDSTCAMAWWGIALSMWTNPMSVANRPPAFLQKGLEAAQRAEQLGRASTEREREYIAAVGQLFTDVAHRDQRTRILAYERAMADMVARQPTDTEAMIFHALSLVAAASPSDKSYANQLRAGATLEAIWAKQPDHPGLAHYIIHSYDVPALASRAAAAAQRYADIAPSAAHALHMPSHTFTRVGRWQESVNTNRRSIEAAQTEGSFGEALHASDYMEYAYLQMRRLNEAKAVLDGLPALSAKLNPSVVAGAAPPSAGVFALAAIPARYALERHKWDEAAMLTPRSTVFPYADAVTWFARALGSSRIGDTAAARVAADSLGVLRQRLVTQKEEYWAEQVAIQEIAARAWIALAQRRSDDALAKMREASVREDATEKGAITPGPLAPARELLGDMLLELGRPADALAEYRKTMEKEPNRYWALAGARTAAGRSGDAGAAARYAAMIDSLTTERNK